MHVRELYRDVVWTVRMLQGLGKTKGPTQTNRNQSLLRVQGMKLFRSHIRVRKRPVRSLFMSYIKPMRVRAGPVGVNEEWTLGLIYSDRK